MLYKKDNFQYTKANRLFEEQLINLSQRLCLYLKIYLVSCEEAFIIGIYGAGFLSTHFSNDLQALVGRAQ